MIINFKDTLIVPTTTVAGSNVLVAATTMTVADATYLPAAPFYMQFDSGEWVFVSAGGNGVTTLTIQRGISSSAAQHNVGEGVTQVVTSETFNTFLQLQASAIAQQSGSMSISGSGTFGSNIKALFLQGTKVTLSYSATITLDPTIGDLFTVLTTSAVGNATINANSVGVAGQRMYIQITNDASAPRTITLGTNLIDQGNVVGTVNNTVVVLFESDGTNWYEAGRSSGGGAPTGAAGGGLGGSYPNPTVLDLTDSPAQHSLLGWTMDPQTGPGSVVQTTNTRLYLNRIYVPVGGTAANLYTYISTGGTGGGTTNGNFCGIYDANFNLLATTAAQDTAFAGTGLITMPLTASVALTGGTFYYLALTTAFVTATPFFARAASHGSSTLTNLGQTATAPATARALSKTAVITALPNPLVSPLTDSQVWFIAVGV